MTSRAFSAIDLQVVQATQPYLVYHRYALTGLPRVYSMYEVPYGFNYLLRRVLSRWDATGSLADNPPLSAELFNSAQSRARQNVPIPFALFSSPGADATTVLELGAPFNRSMNALPRTSARIINVAFPYGDTIKLVINTAAPALVPTFIDLVLDGYLIAESQLSMWGNSGGGENG